MPKAEVYENKQGSRGNRIIISLFSILIVGAGLLTAGHNKAYSAVTNPTIYTTKLGTQETNPTPLVLPFQNGSINWSITQDALNINMAPTNSWFGGIVWNNNSNPNNSQQCYQDSNGNQDCNVVLPPQTQQAIYPLPLAVLYQGYNPSANTQPAWGGLAISLPTMQVAAANYSAGQVVCYDQVNTKQNVPDNQLIPQIMQIIHNNPVICTQPTCQAFNGAQVQQGQIMGCSPFNDAAHQVYVAQPFVQSAQSALTATPQDQGLLVTACSVVSSGQTSGCVVSTASGDPSMQLLGTAVQVANYSTWSVQLQMGLQNDTADNLLATVTYGSPFVFFQRNGNYPVGLAIYTATDSSNTGNATFLAIASTDDSTTPMQTLTVDGIAIGWSVFAVDGKMYAVYYPAATNSSNLNGAALKLPASSSVNNQTLYLQFNNNSTTGYFAVLALPFNASSDQIASNSSQYYQTLTLTNDQLNYVSQMANYAFNFITNTDFKYYYNTSNSHVYTAFYASTKDVLTGDTDVPAVIGLYPHQYMSDPLDSSRSVLITDAGQLPSGFSAWSQPLKSLSVSYPSLRGPIALYTGNGFATDYIYRGILPWMPALVGTDSTPASLKTGTSNTGFLPNVNNSILFDCQTNSANEGNPNCYPPGQADNANSFPSLNKDFGGMLAFNQLNTDHQVLERFISRTYFPQAPLWLQPLDDNSPLPPTTVLSLAKALSSGANVMILAQQQQNIRYAQELQWLVSQGLESFFAPNKTATNSATSNYFYYDPNFNSLYGYMSGLGPNAQFGNAWDSHGAGAYNNDHMVQYGYLVRAAALLALSAQDQNPSNSQNSYDASQALSFNNSNNQGLIDANWVQTWAPYINQLVYDYGNPYKLDCSTADIAVTGGCPDDLVGKAGPNLNNGKAAFPFLRYFDPYAGHAWATGYVNAMTGPREGSIAQEINAWQAMILWGAATNNPALINAGVYMYTTAIQSAYTYWYDSNQIYAGMKDEKSGAIFAASKGSNLVAQISGGMVQPNSFFSSDPYANLGVGVFPITGGSNYLFANPSLMQSLLANATNTRYGNWPTEAGKTGNPQFVNNPWQITMDQLQAVFDPAGALTQLETHANTWQSLIVDGSDQLWSSYLSPLNGESYASAYSWIKAINELGTPDLTITANTPLYAVFKQGKHKTYVVYNATGSPINVSFSDGKNITAAANHMTVVGPSLPKPVALPTHNGSAASKEVIIAFPATSGDGNPLQAKVLSVSGDNNVTQYIYSPACGTQQDCKATAYKNSQQLINQTQSNPITSSSNGGGQLAINLNGDSSTTPLDITLSLSGNGNTSSNWSTCTIRFYPDGTPEQLGICAYPTAISYVNAANGLASDTNNSNTVTFGRYNPNYDTRGVGGVVPGADDDSTPAPENLSLNSNLQGVECDRVPNTCSVGVQWEQDFGNVGLGGSYNFFAYYGSVNGPINVPFQGETSPTYPQCAMGTCYWDCDPTSSGNSCIAIITSLPTGQANSVQISLNPTSSDFPASPLSNTLIVNTPPASPISITVLNQGPNWVELQWYQPDCMQSGSNSTVSNNLSFNISAIDTVSNNSVSVIPVNPSCTGTTASVYVVGLQSTDSGSYNLSVNTVNPASAGSLQSTPASATVSTNSTVATPTGLTLNSVSSTSSNASTANISWVETGFQEGNYSFAVSSTNPGVTVNFESGPNCQDNGSCTATVAITGTGLNTGSTINIMLQANYQYNNDNISSAQSAPLPVAVTPNQPIGLSATSIDATTEQLTWTQADCNTSMTFTYGGLGSGNSGLASCTAGVETVYLYDLTPGTSYNVTITALQNQLSSPASQPIPFTTTTSISQPQNLLLDSSVQPVVTSGSSASVGITWEQVGESYNFTAILANTSTTQFSLQQLSCESGTCTSIVQGLPTGNTTNIQLIANYQNQYFSSPSNSLPIATPPQTPGTVAAQAINVNSEQLTWTQPECAYNPSNPNLTFGVTISPSSGVEGADDVACVSNTPTAKVILNNLTPGTTYSGTVTAYNGSNLPSPSSSSFSFTTSNFTWSNPLITTNITNPISVNVSWPDNANAPQGVQVTYTPVLFILNNEQFTQSTITAQNVTSTSATFNGLQPGATYEVQVTATDSENDPAITNSSQQFTMPNASITWTPSGVQVPSASLTATSAVISWNPASDGIPYSTITYNVNLYEGNSSTPSQTSATTNTNVIFSNLTPNTSYRVQVTASDIYNATSGPQPSSPGLAFTTLPAITAPQMTILQINPNGSAIVNFNPAITNPPGQSASYSLSINFNQQGNQQEGTTSGNSIIIPLYNFQPGSYSFTLQAQVSATLQSSQICTFYYNGVSQSMNFSDQNCTPPTTSEIMMKKRS